MAETVRMPVSTLSEAEAPPAKVTVAPSAKDEKDESLLPSRQVVFFIRHAESRWNRAQEDYSLIGMMYENDHGLSEDGCLQAEELRRRLCAARLLLEAADESSPSSGTAASSPAAPVGASGESTMVLSAEAPSVGAVAADAEGGASASYTLTSAAAARAAAPSPASRAAPGPGGCPDSGAGGVAIDVEADGASAAVGAAHRAAAEQEAANQAVTSEAYQALRLAEADLQWVRWLLQPDKVYSSPFTRAACTACIGLRDLTTEERPLVLLKEARESKNIGGADSTGVAVGEEIKDRVLEEVQALYEEATKDARDRALEEIRNMPIDASEVGEAWWGCYTGDSQDDTDERIDALVARLRKTGGSLPEGGGVSVVVGHSLFFRSLFRAFIAGSALTEICDPRVAASLQANVLPFCGVVGTVFEWDKMGDCRIIEARPLLGTTLSAARPIANVSQPPRGGGIFQATIAGCVCGRRAPTSCISQ